MTRTNKTEVTLDRRDAADRRVVEDLRKSETSVAVEHRQAPRRKIPRRRQIDPTTCERDYSDQEIEFMQAMDAYKRSSGRMFPTCSEILEVLRDLGYRQVGALDEPLPADAAEIEAETDDADADLVLESEDLDEVLI